MLTENRCVLLVKVIFIPLENIYFAATFVAGVFLCYSDVFDPTGLVTVLEHNTALIFFLHTFVSLAVQFSVVLSPFEM